MRLVNLVITAVLVVGLGCARTSDSGGAGGQETGVSGAGREGGPDSGPESVGQPESLETMETPSEAGISDEPVFVELAGVLPAEWPDDVPICPGLTVRTGKKAGENGYMIGAVGNISYDEVFSFYDSLEGWRAEATRASGGSAGVSKEYVKGAEELEVYVQDAEEGIMVRLTYYDRGEE